MLEVFTSNKTNWCIVHSTIKQCGQILVCDAAVIAGANRVKYILILCCRFVPQWVNSLCVDQLLTKDTAKKRDRTTELVEQVLSLFQVRAHTRKHMYVLDMDNPCVRSLFFT